MPDELPYGARFISHLRSISRRSHFNYNDLQAIKEMSRDDLADALCSKCPQFARIVVEHSPEQAAELYQKRSDEISAKNREAWEIVHAASGLLDAIVYYFAVFA